MTTTRPVRSDVADYLATARSAFMAASYLEDSLHIDLAEIINSFLDGYPEHTIALCGNATESILFNAWHNMEPTGKADAPQDNDGLQALCDKARKRNPKLFNTSLASDLVQQIQKYRNLVDHWNPGPRPIPDELVAKLVLMVVTLIEWYEEAGLGGDTDTPDQRRPVDETRWKTVSSLPDPTTMDVAPPCAIFKWDTRLAVAHQKARSGKLGVELGGLIHADATQATVSFDGHVVAMATTAGLRVAIVSSAGTVTHWPRVFSMPEQGRLLATRHDDDGRSVEVVALAQEGLVTGTLGSHQESWSIPSDHHPNDAARVRNRWIEVDQAGSISNAPQLPARVLDGHILAIDAADLGGSPSGLGQLIVLATRIGRDHYLRFVLQRGGSEPRMGSIPLSAEPGSVHASRVFDRETGPSVGAVIANKLEIWDCDAVAES